MKPVYKKSDFVNFETIRQEWMKNPKYVAELKKLEPEFNLARQVIGARIKQKMTQEKLAAKAKTSQAVISRIEGAVAKPSLSLLRRIAAALETPLHLIIPG